MLSKYFKFNELGTNLKNEIIGGMTTFFTMAYIIIVNPKILEAAGIPFGPSMVATIISAFFGTLALGVYAKKPFAIAPYMGENAFIAYTVVNVLGYSWQTALGAIFIGGVLFTILTIFKIRSWLANAIPECLKIAFAVGIGFFLTFIGLTKTGIITLGVEGAPVHVGNFGDIKIIFALVSFLLMGILMIWRVTGAMIIVILLMSVVGFITQVSPFPDKILSIPPDIFEIAFKLDIIGALQWGFFAVILTVFVMDFVDTLGTLLGLGYKANLLDEHGNMPDIERPMLCDALSTIVGALCGTTTCGIYIESAAGMQAGAKSGFASVITALFFLLALFLAPLFTAIPDYAYAPALMIVGVLMMSPIAKLKFDELEQVIPAFVTITFMSFTFNLGIGLTAGLVSYPLIMTLAGKWKEVKIGMWILCLLSILFYIFYPY